MQDLSQRDLHKGENFLHGRLPMGMPGIWELVIIFFIVLIIFGAGKIPKIARDIGGGIKEFKKSISGEEDQEEKKDEKE
jgi:sec-independent protein translocase protein TatA